MSRKSQRASRRDWQRQHPPEDTARDRASRKRDTTPPEWRPVREPFYLPELGLTREPFVGRVPPNLGGPIIRRKGG